MSITHGCSCGIGPQGPPLISYSECNTKRSKEVDSSAHARAIPLPLAIIFAFPSLGMSSTWNLSSHRALESKLAQSLDFCFVEYHLFFDVCMFTHQVRTSSSVIRLGLYMLCKMLLLLKLAVWYQACWQLASSANPLLPYARPAALPEWPEVPASTPDPAATGSW